MEVDLQSCGTLFSLLPSDIKCQQKYVESLFRSPLVCNEFYALYFFYFLGFFYCFTCFSSVWMAREFENHGASPCAHHSGLVYTSLRFAFWHTLPDFLPVRNWKSSNRGSFPPPSTAAAHSPWQLGVQLRGLGGDGLGSSLLSRAWRGSVLLINTCWSLCQLVWAPTVLGWFDSRDVRTRATIRPLLAQT